MLRHTSFTPVAMPSAVRIPEQACVPVKISALVVTRNPFDEADELYYLQAIRQNPTLLSGDLMRARCQLYKDHAPDIAGQLVAAAGVQECDALIGVPTRRRELLQPYMEAARSLHPAIMDLTPMVWRDPDAGSTSNLSFAERQARHKLTGSLPVMRRVLVLDDFIATGESVTHIVEILRRNAATMPEVLVAAPLWVPPKDQRWSFLEGVTEARLRWLISRAEIGALRTDVNYRQLYDSDVATRPLFCFGRAPVAPYFTIGANPSADDFRAGRWGPGDLGSQSLSYFERGVPHGFFANWEAALDPLGPGMSYRSGHLAHLDISPRATKSLSTINQLGNSAISEFLTMASADAAYLFKILAIVWPQVRGLFAAGTITKKRYIDDFLAAVGPSHGFVFRRRLSGLEHSKIYDVASGERTVPLFFCPKGPSARRPGEQKFFRAEIRDNADYLRGLFL